MQVKRFVVLAVCGALLSLVAFLVVAYLVGSRLAAPSHSGPHVAPRDLPVQAVSFESPTGSRLSGWYGASARDCGTVVLLHGVRSDKRAMVPRAKFLAAAGYGVLLMDFQAHGESDGDHITFGHLEREDAAAALAFVAERSPNRPVAVIGQSMGGAAAVLNGRALAADAVVLEAVYPTLEKAVFNRVQLHAGDLGPLDELVAGVLLLQLKLRLDVDPDELRPLDHIAELEAPLLLIAGDADRHTTLDDTQRLFARASEPKQVWIIEGAGHVDLHRYDPDSYEKTVLGFLGKHMPCT